MTKNRDSLRVMITPLDCNTKISKTYSSECKNEK